MLRWLTTPYRQPDPLPNSAKISPIKPNHFSTEPSSNDRLAEALRTRNPRWTTRALWYPPAQSRRYLPNAGAPVGERDAPGTVSKGPWKTFQATMPEKPEQKRRRGRPETRRVKIDATPEQVAKAMFAAAKPPDPSKRIANRPKATQG